MVFKNVKCKRMNSYCGNVEKYDLCRAAPRPKTQSPSLFLIIVDTLTVLLAKLGNREKSANALLQNFIDCLILYAKRTAWHIRAHLYENMCPVERNRGRSKKIFFYNKIFFSVSHSWNFTIPSTSCCPQ